MAEKLPEAVSLIFSAHLLILRVDRFVETMACQIKEGKPVSRAVLDVAQCYIDKFASSKSIHIREKAQDVEDVAVRLASNMSDAMKLDSDLKRHEIVIVQNVYPSELVMLSLEEPTGVVLVGGGATSQVSILARSLRLPLFITDDPTTNMNVSKTPNLGYARFAFRFDIGTSFGNSYGRYFVPARKHQSYGSCSQWLPR